MSSALSSHRMRLLALSLLAALLPAVGLAGRAQAVGALPSPPLIAGVNYPLAGCPPPPLLATAANGPTLNLASAAVAQCNAGSGLALQDAVAFAFQNPNASGDQSALTLAFLTGFVEGTPNGQLDNPATGDLAHALLQADVPASTILLAAATATGTSLGTVAPGSTFCSFLAGIISGPAATDTTTFLTAAATLSPSPLLSCGLVAPAPSE